MGWISIDKNKKYSKVELYKRAHVGMGQKEACEKMFWDFVETNQIKYCYGAWTNYIEEFKNKLKRAEGNCNLIDHERVYKDVNNKIIVVAQPYADEKIIRNNKQFNEFCKENNIKYEVNDRGSWYYPTSCCLFTIFYN